MEVLDNNHLTNKLNIEYANFGHRLLAVIVDFFVMIIPVAGTFYYGFMEKNLVFMLICNVVMMLYKPVMEGIYGATLGKMAVGIKMVDSDFDQIDLTQSFTKNGIYLISSVVNILSAFWMFGQDAFMEAEGFVESTQAGQGSPYQLVSTLISVLILISCLMMLASDKQQTLHDRVAGTFCIRK